MKTRSDPPEDLDALRGKIAGLGERSFRKSYYPKLRQQVADLNKALAELERSKKELEEFLYTASHDLREPLRGVTNFLQLLEAGYQGRLDEKANRYIAFAVDGAKRMQGLLDDLLLYSRLSRGVEFGPVDTNELLKRALSELAVFVRESQAVVTSDVLPTVWGDQKRLLQLFQNLIANALKFRRPDLPPAVHIAARPEGKRWLFSVRDNGIGIKPEYFARIFQIFQRLHARDEYPGTGIGLTLCKKIVEIHGGRIWLESSPGEGTIFFFTLAAHAGERG